MFTGVGVALVTLFDGSGRLDADATADHAARLVDLGVAALIVAGTTGEPTALDRAERIELLEAIRKNVPDFPVIAGTGTESPAYTVTLTRDAIESGADAVLALAPPAPVDVRSYYDQVCSAAGEVPVLAYHFPAVSAPGFPPAALADFGVAGVKDSSGDPKRLFEILDGFDGAVYPGSPFLLSVAGSHGAAGAILAVANVAPEAAIRAFDGDDDAQREVARIALTLTGNRWTAIKSATADRFGTSPYARLV